MSWFKRFLNFLFGKKQLSICELVRQGNFSEVKRVLTTDPGLINFNKNQYGVFPLHVAAHDGQLEIVKLLLDYNPAIDALDRDSSTALFSAALAGHAEIIDLLANAGADVNHKADEGVTPLHVAAMNGHSKAVQCLLKKGAMRDISDNSGATPLSLVDDLQSEVYRLLSS